MINLDSKIRISYNEPGSVLISRGNYTSAKIKVVNAWQTNEEMKIIKPSETIKTSVYRHSIVQKVLGEQFISHWLDRTSWKPSYKLKSSKDRFMTTVYKDWKKLSKEQILITSAKLLLIDLEIDYNTAKIEII